MGDLALLGCPALGEQPSPLTFPLWHQIIAPYRAENWQTTQRKPERPVPTLVDLWLGAGCQNRDTTKQRSGDCLATQRLPSP